MFEKSLVASQASSGPSSRHWTTAVSVLLQCSIAALLCVLPLLHTETLRFHVEVPRVLPMLRHDPPPVPKVLPAHTATAVAAAAPVQMSQGRPLLAPNPMPNPIDTSDAPIAKFGDGVMQAALPIGLGTTPNRGATVVPAPSSPKQPLRVSAGVSAGLLLQPIRPIYPKIAVASRTEGTVVIEAILSKTGRIESAHVLSGPVMLRQAALDAVGTARYSPYTLNGQPTEVETTITINFRLGG